MPGRPERRHYAEVMAVDGDTTVKAIATDPSDFLRIEAAAILHAADQMDHATFAEAVQMLLACRGKIIVTGAGTSGILGRKLAATMTSTGTPAVFLHPSDALHGGLGIIATEDVVLAISNSGETAEILAMLPYLRHRQVSIVSIVGGAASSLGRASDVALEAAVDREACPLDLTPTASAVVALAVGDALALILMEARGFTAEGFARNHPSGRLGKRLTLRVADLMRSDPSLSIEPGTSWHELVSATSHGGLGAVAVVANGVLVGIVTDGDLRRSMEVTEATRIDALTAADVMTADPITTTASTLAFEAMQAMEMRDSPITVLPVVDPDGACVGMVRLHDLVRSGIA